MQAAGSRQAALNAHTPLNGAQKLSINMREMNADSRLKPTVEQLARAQLSFY